MNNLDKLIYPNLFTPSRSHEPSGSKIVYVIQEEDYYRLWEELKDVRHQRWRYKRWAERDGKKLAILRRLIESKIAEIDYMIAKIEFDENGRSNNSNLH